MSTVVLSCGPPYLLDFTVTALNGAELRKHVHRVRFRSFYDQVQCLAESAQSYRPVAARRFDRTVSPKASAYGSAANARQNDARLVALGEHDSRLVGKRSEGNGCGWRGGGCPYRKCHPVGEERQIG